jgi:VanZ family protein
MTDKNMAKRLLVIRLILIFFILFTLLFIWSNSLQNATSSAIQSGFFANAFRQIFDITREPFRFLYNNLRKVAHFLEFSLLGFEMAALACAGFQKKRKAGVLGFAGCFFAALVDEGIQLFVPGRVAAISDVCLDSLGALCGFLTFLGVAALVWSLFKKK